MYKPTIKFKNIKKGLLTVVILAVVGSSFQSCKKDDNNNNNNNGTPSASTIPPLSSADAALVAIKTKSYVSYLGYTTELVIGTGVGAFGITNGSTNYSDVGAITIDGESLTKQSNNAYIYTPTATNPEGLSLGIPVDWTVAGGNGFSGFSKSVTIGFPSVDSINSSGTIDKSQSYTLSTATVYSSDSVVFQIAGGNGNKLVTRPGGTTSYTFSAADVASVGTGDAIVQIAPYRYTSDVQGGKTIYYINETVVTKTVKIQ